jgi:O-antigen/teichoic acid export membrane protein
MDETMVDVPAPAVRVEEASGPRTAGVRGTRQMVRGSSLLLVGRFISVALNFGVQVLTVRYLSKAHYGSFAFGIGVAALGTSVVLVGLAKAMPRLVPIYHEKKDNARTFGSIVLAAGTIAGLGLALVVGLHLFQGAVGTRTGVDGESLSLLLVLIALAPLDAFDQLLQQLVAVFCSPRAIFLRRQVLGPGLKLAAIGLVYLLGGSVYLLAYAYLVGSAIGVSLYVATLVRQWKREGLLGYLRPGRFTLPVREVFGFSLPMISTDLSVAVRGSLVVIMLEHLRNAASVADYRAVVSVANLNTVVFDAFAFLFVPLASRMFARDDRKGIGDLYWLTSLWITILTFPVFVVTCLLAPTVTVLLFGHRYAQSGTLLSILAIGQYFNAALGFNASTLRVHGRLRYIVAGDVLGAVLSLVLGYLLIWKYGALGGAISTTLTLIVQNIFAHVGLWTGRTGVPLFAWRYVRVYALIVLMTAGLAVYQWLLAPPPWLTAALAGVACLAAARVSRHVLDPRTTFPELLRVPALRWLLA